MLMMISNSSSIAATKSITVRLSNSRSPAKVVPSVMVEPFLLKGSISVRMRASISARSMPRTSEVGAEMSSVEGRRSALVEQALDRVHERAARHRFGKVALGADLADSLFVALAGVGRDGQDRDVAQFGIALQPGDQVEARNVLQ